MNITKTFWHYTVQVTLIASALLLDLLVFEQWNGLVLQALLCTYIVTLIKSEGSGSIFLLFITALAVESQIIFSHVSYGLYVALFLIPLTLLLRTWLDTLIVTALASLAVVLPLQQVLFIAHQQTSSINLKDIIGHFLINGLFLMIYWVFDKNGKQGNRS